MLQCLAMMLSAESIREKALQCKSAGEDAIHRFYLPLVVIFVGIAAFALGALSTQNAQGSAITQVATPLVATKPLSIGGLYVASKSGSKYHYPWCSGARSIAEHNTIWFKSTEEARAAGYTPAKNCKGLE